jgi:predicted DNA-binding transcriptional regulator YafY
MTGTLQTPIKNGGKRPLTLLELRFLKTIAQDPRMALFEEELHLQDLQELQQVEPLFMQDDVVYFDRYLDGDPYGEEHYQQVFRHLMQGIHGKKALAITYETRRTVKTFRGIPKKMEYSEKDDKFRVLLRDHRGNTTLNVARIKNVEDCEKLEEVPEYMRVVSSAATAICVLELVDERNALERALLHFAHFEKTAERLEGQRYRLVIHYQQEDETELVIRVLSFGPFVRVVEPDHFVNLIRERLMSQKGLLK